VLWHSFGDDYFGIIKSKKHKRRKTKLRKLSIRAGGILPMQIKIFAGGVK